MTKATGFTEWWTQHRGEFSGFSGSLARSIYDAEQRIAIDAMRGVRERTAEQQLGFQMVVPEGVCPLCGLENRK